MDRPMQLTRTSLGCGRKLGTPEKTHSDSGCGCEALFFSPLSVNKTTMNKSTLFENLLYSLVPGPLLGAGDSEKNVTSHRSIVTRTHNGEDLMSKAAWACFSMLENVGGWGERGIDKPKWEKMTSSSKVLAMHSGIGRDMFYLS